MESYRVVDALGRETWVIRPVPVGPEICKPEDTDSVDWNEVTR